MLTVREISETEHLSHLASLRSASFLQTPAWGRVKAEWTHESIGVFDGDRLVGSALVLFRQLPRLRRYLAYLPEGPSLEDGAWEGWASDDVAAWTRPLVAHLKARGAFGVRMGPPVLTRRWDTAAIKTGIADPAVGRLDDVAPTERGAAGARVVSGLRSAGWHPLASEGGFAAGQPQFVFQVPLRHADGTARTEEEVLKAMNQLWRRNIKKAAKEGVEVTSCAPGTPDSDAASVAGELKAFHDLYVHTAERDHFTPRGLRYFEVMLEALGAESPDRIRLWSARHEGDLVASTIAIRVGAHDWYSYGASSTEKRDVRGSNAIQWAMMRDALAAGADVYDLRGITDTLDPEDSHAGLIQFKVGTGGEAIEYVGEWDLPVRPLLYRAFDLYLRRRG